MAGKQEHEYQPWKMDDSVNIDTSSRNFQLFCIYLYRGSQVLTLPSLLILLVDSAHALVFPRYDAGPTSSR